MNRIIDVLLFSMTNRQDFFARLYIDGFLHVIS
jgi:hypothetical protein